jgi:hypothetical protein
MDEKDVNELLLDKYLELDNMIRPIIHEKNQQQSNTSDKLVHPLFLKDNDYYRDRNPKWMMCSISLRDLTLMDLLERNCAR